MSKKSRKVRWYPGNTIMSQVAFDEHVMSVGRGWLEFVRAVDRSAKEGTLIERLSVRGLGLGDGSMLVVLTARAEQGALVAFHNPDDEMTLWTGLGNRMKAGRLKWRHDEYRE